MGKGFIMAITTALILVVMMLYAQSFAAKKDGDISGMAQSLVSDKVIHAWRDINKDVFLITGIDVEKENNTVTFNDTLPAPFDISDMLSLYGQFISQYYLTPDVEIAFLNTNNQPLNLSNLPSKITILPMNIEYYYPSWSKREMFITAPASNFTAIQGIALHLHITNAIMQCYPANLSLRTPCTFIAPDKECDATTIYPLYLNFSASDYAGQYYSMGPKCFDLSKHSTESLNVQNESANYYIKLLMGPLPLVLDVQLQNTAVNATTTIILNTSDFYINHLSKLKVSAVGYSTSKVDWS